MMVMLNVAIAGLSPRVRGKLVQAVLFPAVVGSIPACAGEAPPPRRRERHCRVYPRVCGGSYPKDEADFHGDGLSPRVRGKRYRYAEGGIPCGSIPACAGEACFIGTCGG